MPAAVPQYLLRPNYVIYFCKCIFYILFILYFFSVSLSIQFCIANNFHEKDDFSQSVLFVFTKAVLFFYRMAF